MPQRPAPEIARLEPPPAAGSPAPSSEPPAPARDKIAGPGPVAPQKILPESLPGTPATDHTSARLRNDTVLLARTAGVPPRETWQVRKNLKDQIVGFEFSNHGGNRILPERYDIDKNLLFTRDFQFRFDDRARQDIHLAITDWAPARNRQFLLSDLMNSVILFFPRSYLPAIRTADGRTVVTLPTGETVEFDGVTREIVGGVLSEAPVDLSPRSARKFAGVTYTGRGLVVRANARGADPRIATTATILNSARAAACRVPAAELWQQSGAVRFRFPADPDFDRYLRSRCGFGLPPVAFPAA